jgi:hypothetical protein
MAFAAARVPAPRVQMQGAFWDREIPCSSDEALKRYMLKDVDIFFHE